MSSAVRVWREFVVECEVGKKARFLVNGRRVSFREYERLLKSDKRHCTKCGAVLAKTDG
jgi:hypothetical protein